MITILADHNIEGQATLLWDTLVSEGWLDLYPLRLVRFMDVALPADSTDRDVWRFAQTHRLISLTDNRNMDDADSLEQTIRDENQFSSLPVINIGSIDRLRSQDYRVRCVTRLMEIVLDLDTHLGVGRLYIP